MKSGTFRSKYRAAKTSVLEILVLERGNYTVFEDEELFSSSDIETFFSDRH
jgi:hypothetical protein